ncbi:MAG: hypothetical protein LBV29_01155 [Azoarcus sp.]|jgi:hypothetical protein|nr:hypothetical protein [Azoarcus sp.]
MHNIVNFDFVNRRQKPSNHVFQVYPEDSDREDYLSAFMDEDDFGVYIDFLQDIPDQPGISTVLAGMWLNLEQCEEVGKALLAAAQVIREANFRDANSRGNGA